MIDSKAARIAWRMAVNVCRLLGAIMRIDLLKVRNFKIISSLAFCLAMLPSASHAFTQEDQRRLCTGDVFRLCSSEIPDVGRITACMRRQRASLSQGCRSSSASQSNNLLRRSNPLPFSSRDRGPRLHGGTRGHRTHWSCVTHVNSLRRVADEI